MKKNRAIYLLSLLVSVSAFAGPQEIFDPCLNELKEKSAEFNKQLSLYEVCGAPQKYRISAQMKLMCGVEFYEMGSGKKMFREALPELQRKLDYHCVFSTPLTRAVQIRPELVEDLLRAGASANFYDSRCRTPGSWAVQEQNGIATLQTLKKYNADFSLLDYREQSFEDGSKSCDYSTVMQSLLHVAVEYELETRQKLDFLLANGAKKHVKTYNFFGATPLITLAEATFGMSPEQEGFFVDKAKTLIKAGSDVNQLTLDRGGWTDDSQSGQPALFFAIYSRSIDLVKYLVEGANANVNHSNTDGIHVMDDLDANEDTDLIQYLCGKDAKHALCGK